MEPKQPSKFLTDQDHRNEDLHLIGESIAPPKLVLPVGSTAAPIVGASPYPARADHQHGWDANSVIQMGRGSKVGSVVTPKVFFFQDTQTGIYRPTGGGLTIVSAGAEVANFLGTGVNVFGNIFTATGNIQGGRYLSNTDGSASAPSIGFNNWTQHGLYAADGLVGIAAAGAEVGRFFNGGGVRRPIFDNSTFSAKFRNTRDNTVSDSEWWQDFATIWLEGLPGHASIGFSSFDGTNNRVVCLRGSLTDSVLEVVNAFNTGYASIRATSFIVASSREYKENIQEIPRYSWIETIQKHLALVPKTWNWKYQTERGNGFIAEEVQEVYPHALSQNGKSIDPLTLVAELWNTVTSLIEKVTSLESEIERLKHGTA